MFYSAKRLDIFHSSNSRDQIWQTAVSAVVCRESIVVTYFELLR